MLDTDLKIVKIRNETYNVKTFRLDLEGHEFSFAPGQFISLQVETPEGKQTRSFSISSSPLDKKFIEITVKRYEDSLVAKTLHEMKEGQTIKVRAPFGQFVLKDDDQNVCMIAGGNGITPLMSMIRYITDKKLKIKPILLYSNQTEKDIIFRNELESYRNQGLIDVFFTLTQEATSSWRGLTGRVDEKMIRACFGDLEEKQFFLCGPPQMVQAMAELLEGLGVLRQNIRMEEFIRPKKLA